MDKINQGLLDSLDLPDKEMESYIPYVLQDLFELGSIPDYIYQLIDKYAETNRTKKIIDLGCGKGAVLIYLAKRMEFQGLGIDIVPEFIESAKRHSIENSLTNQLDFITGDILKHIDLNEHYDIIIYGYDSGILGDLYKTISRLQNGLTDSGYLIVEIAFTPDNRERIEGLPTKKELLEQLDKSGLRIVDKIFWDTDKIRAINNQNNIYINKRIQELIKKYPAQKHIFERYMSKQIYECKLIENEMICSTWIMKK